MWEMSEGDPKFLYTMKLVPPKYLGSIVHLNIIYLFIFILVLVIDKERFAYKCFIHSAILEHALIFLKCMVNEHLSMN